MTFRDAYNGKIGGWFLAYGAVFLGNYLKDRYGGFTIKYDLFVMEHQLIALLENYKLEIEKIQILINDKAFLTDFKNWSDSVTNSLTSSATATQNADLKYSGFNVSGKFSENDATATNSSTADNKTNTVNLLNQYLRLTDKSINGFYNNISKEFENLLIMWYN